MAAVVEVESTVTERGQTTVPMSIRRMLGRPGRLVWRASADGTIHVSRKDGAEEEPDPALGPFLALLEKDMAAHPERIRMIDADTVTRLSELVDGVEVDLDEPLPDDGD